MLTFRNFRALRCCWPVFSKLRVEVDGVPDVGLFPFRVGCVGVLLVILGEYGVVCLIVVASRVEAFS